jgi:hypothetical protein
MNLFSNTLFVNSPNQFTNLLIYKQLAELNHFLSIKNNQLFISPEGLSTLRPDMLSEGNAAHTVGCDSRLQIVMAVWRPFCLNSPQDTGRQL